MFLSLAAAASAVPLVVSATLSGEAENPDVVTDGTGWAVVTYDPDAHTLRVQVEFSGLTGMTTASHIHAPINPMNNNNAGVATQTPSFTGFPLGVTSGSYDHTFDLTDPTSWNASFITANGGTVAGAEVAFAGYLADGRAYLNVHSTYAPGGEIRGDLKADAVPDTAALVWLLAPVLAGLSAMARRLRPLAA